MGKPALLLAKVFCLKPFQYLAVANRGHEAAVVESLRAVVRVAKVLLEVLRWLVVAVRGVVDLLLLLLLHVVSGSRHAAPSLLNKKMYIICQSEGKESIRHIPAISVVKNFKLSKTSSSRKFSLTNIASAFF
jgi:hypothetical protein